MANQKNINLQKKETCIKNINLQNKRMQTCKHLCGVWGNPPQVIALDLLFAEYKLAKLRWFLKSRLDLRVYKGTWVYCHKVFVKTQTCFSVFLRIQFKLNTALLSYCPFVCPSVTGVTSHISHIYKGINAMLIIKPWIKIILAIFLAKTRPDKTIFSALTNLTINFDFKLSKV